MIKHPQSPTLSWLVANANPYFWNERQIIYVRIPDRRLAIAGPIIPNREEGQIAGYVCGAEH